MLRLELNFSMLAIAAIANYLAPGAAGSLYLERQWI
jgi:hypothetical protein